MSELPRRFHLLRHRDVSGISGTGIVADGVVWPDLTVSIRWRGDRPSIVHWGHINDAAAVHGHGGATEFVWLDSAGEQAPYGLVPGCTHCPDGHTPPDHGQPWGVYVSPERDGDGQPMTITVARSAGAHVAESDAEWVRTRLNSDG